MDPRGGMHKIPHGNHYQGRGTVAAQRDLKKPGSLLQ